MRTWLILSLLCLLALGAYSPRKSVDKEKALANKKKSEQPLSGEMDEGDIPERKLDEIAIDAGFDDMKSRKKPSGKPDWSNYKDWTVIRIGDTKRMIELKDELKRAPPEDVARLRKQIQEEDEANDDDHQYQACSMSDKEEDQLCHCDGDEIDCSNVVLDDDDPRLRTANLKIMKKKFKPIIANFSSNAVSRLQEKKVLPGFEKYVSVLDFTENEIRYIDGDTFVPFTNLSKLSLRRNNLRVAKQKWFTPIGKTLHRLDLSYNGILSFPKGVFSDLKNLKKLIIDGNPIREWSKEVFEGLENLEELSMDDCNIKELPGDVFSNLPKLRGISLRLNPFEEIPKAIVKTTQLKEIDLSETNLVEIRENSFVHHPNLEELYLEEMKFLSVVRDCAFCGLSMLKTLYLNDNAKLFEINPNAFGLEGAEPGYKATALEELQIHNCNLTNISEVMVDFDHLKKLTAGGNPWTCDCFNSFLFKINTQQLETDPLHVTCIPVGETEAASPVSIRTYLNKCSKPGVTSRLYTVIILFMVVSAVIGIVYIGVVKRGFHKIYQRLQTHTVPDVTYSNLTDNFEDGISLDTDFNPRPAEV
ncbi:unnamed protein product [Caenorhabditis bovis]|uniref:LRRCT domain-containing protein n=1 Tax=Caenorhabditis bovis TaxID=2654633 RepID=A0A8S1EHE2_9PELO|nr:unnamed protein product [Caenorhabditis bovis]